MFLHDKGFSHNFINPTSIYLTKDWNARLGNFEYSGSEKRSQIPSVDARFQLKYTSPECVSDSCKISEASDVYSFGCVTWEVFSRKQPWSWLEPEEFAALAIQTGENSARLPMHPCWPSHVKRIVDEATRRDMCDRPSFRSIFEFASQDLLTAAGFHSRPMQRKRSVSRHDFADDDDNDNDDDDDVSRRTTSVGGCRTSGSSHSRMFLRHDSNCPFKTAKRSAPKAPDIHPGDSGPEVVTAILTPGTSRSLDEQLESVLTECKRQGFTEDSLVSKVKEFFKGGDGVATQKKRAPLHRQDGMDETEIVGGVGGQNDAEGGTPSASTRRRNWAKHVHGNADVGGGAVGTKLFL